jgi:hypothetical protein
MTAAVPNSTPFLLKCKMEEAVCSWTVQTSFHVKYCSFPIALENVFLPCHNIHVSWPPFRLRTSLFLAQ